MGPKPDPIGGGALGKNGTRVGSTRAASHHQSRWAGVGAPRRMRAKFRSPRPKFKAFGLALEPSGDPEVMSVPWQVPNSTPLGGH